MFQAYCDGKCTNICLSLRLWTCLFKRWMQLWFLEQFQVFSSAFFCNHIASPNVDFGWFCKTTFAIKSCFFNCRCQHFQSDGVRTWALCSLPTLEESWWEIPVFVFWLCSSHWFGARELCWVKSDVWWQLFAVCLRTQRQSNRQPTQSW